MLFINYYSCVIALLPDFQTAVRPPMSYKISEYHRLPFSTCRINNQALTSSMSLSPVSSKLQYPPLLYLIFNLFHSQALRHCQPQEKNGILNHCRWFGTMPWQTNLSGYQYFKSAKGTIFPDWNILRFQIKIQCNGAFSLSKLDVMFTAVLCFAFPFEILLINILLPTRLPGNVYSSAILLSVSLFTNLSFVKELFEVACDIFIVSFIFMLSFVRWFPWAYGEMYVHFTHWGISLSEWKMEQVMMPMDLCSQSIYRKKALCSEPSHVV